MNNRNSVLAIDIGSGTQDILIWHHGIPMENSPKMILPSATTILSKKIDLATKHGQHIFLSGNVMGGGPSSAAVRRHLKAGFKVFAMEKPALTFHDNLNKVRAMGIEIVEKKPIFKNLMELPMGDLNLSAIQQGLALFGVSLPETVAVAVQDHGFSPDKSNRIFRFKQWNELLQTEMELSDLLYEKPPEHLTRMQAICEIAPGALVMDTGIAAILGALTDPWISARREEGVTIVNIGNEHVLVALVQGNKVWGIYEHHTSLMDPEKLEKHLGRFKREDLSNQEILDEMGHGCTVLSGASRAGAFQHLGVTGPNRERFSGLHGHMAAPFGDMMLTGCFGLLEALKKRV
jgi:uncharacterized protein (DUF1786 family)